MPSKHNISLFTNRFKMEPLITADSRRNESPPLVDLRKKPRYITQLPGEAISENGYRAYVLITNVSLSGLQLEGSGQRLVSLLPKMNQSDPHTPTTLKVCFSVPGPLDQSTDIKIECQTVYAIQEALYSYKIGMKFTAFDKGEDVFENYISARASIR